MKRIFSVLTSFVFALTLLSGCGSSGFGNSNQQENKITPKIEEAIKESFTMDYATKEETLDFFIANDSFDSIVDGGPYYLGAQDPTQPVLIEYEKLRKEKVDEAMELTEDIFQNAKEVKSKLDLLKADYVDFMDAVLPEDKDLKNAAKEFARMIIEFEVREEIIIATYDSIEIPIENAVARAQFQFHKTNLAIELQQVVIDDLAHFTALAPQLYLIFEESENEVIRAALEEFDKNMEKVEELNEIVWEMQDNVIALDVVLKQLNTAEYYMGLASLDYIQQQLPAIKNQISNVEPNDVIDAEDIEFLQEYADVFESFSADNMAMLESIDKKYLLDIDSVYTSYDNSNYWFPSASADGRKYAEKSFFSLNSNESFGNKIKRAPKVVWNQMKTGYKTTKKAFGAAAEGANDIAKTGFDEFFGWYYGNEAADTQAIIDENRKAIAKRWKENRLGAPVFENAEEYFDAAEETGKEIAEGGTKKVFGEGNLSWLAGHMGKITVNIFTGFGKGTMKILNPDSTDGEVAEGFLDVSLSFVGGSKVIFKGSQVAKGGVKSLKIFGEKGLNALGKFFTSNHIKNLKNISKEILTNKKLTSEMVETLMKNAKQIATDEILQKELKVISANLNKKFIDLLKEGGETFLENATKGAKESYKEFMEKAFKNSLQGYKDALKGALGNSFSEYIDNLVANKADDMFKTLVKEYIDKGIIPGLGGPFDGLYRGNIDTEGIIIPVEFKVEDSMIIGNVDFSMSEDGGTLVVDIKFSGSVDETGGVSIIVDSGYFKFAAGEDSTFSCNLGGRVSGLIQQNSMTYNGVINSCSGKFWGEPIEDSAGESIDPLQITFNKIVEAE